MVAIKKINRDTVDFFKPVIFKEIKQVRIQNHTELFKIKLTIVYNSWRNELHAFYHYTKTDSRLIITQCYDHHWDVHANNCFGSTITIFITLVNTCRPTVTMFSMIQLFHINHENVNPFIGICSEAPNVCVLMMYADRGSLQDVLAEPKYDINWEFRICLATDIAKVVCPHVNLSQISSSYEKN